MSIKTLRKRIALVAVSALGVGLLSVAPASAASTVTKITSMNIHANAANGAAADYTYASGGSNTIASSGLVSNPTAALNGSGTTQTATLYSTGVIVVSTASTDAAQEITVTGGTVEGASANTADTVTFAADRTSVARADGAAAGILIAGFKPTAVGTKMIIKGYDNTANAATWIITVTVVAPGSSGTFSAAYSNIALVTSSSDTPDTANIDDATAGTAENGSCVYLYYSLADSLALALTDASVIANVSGDATVGLAAAGDKNFASEDYSSAKRVYICQATSNAPASGTVTLSVDGAVVATKSYKIVGQLAKITVSEDAIAIRNFAGGNGTPSSTTYGSSPYGTAGAGDATWVPSHSYMGYDSAGNSVPVTASIFAPTVDAQVTGLGQVQAADPRNANVYLRSGGLTFACADTSGSNAKLQVKATAADTTTIYSNVFNVTCAGSAVNYTASTDKQVYKTGDVMTVTLNAKDKSGKAINDYARISATGYVGTIASGAIDSTVAGVAAGDTAVAGVATYKYIIDQTAGAYSVAVDFPLINNTTYNQKALALPITVESAVSGGVSNAEVLAAIVKLIASINKQIRALQKSLRR